MTTTFALGLTKTAVEGTLSLVKSAVEEEVELKVKVQNDLMFIIDEFEMMRAFLRVANKERVGNDEVVLTWVRQLRSLAFDVEDCVELVVHLEIKPPSCGGYLRRMLHKVKVYCCAPPLPGTLDLDDAVAEIKQLKARVQDVSQRSTRYNNLISNSNDTQQGPPAEELDCSARASFSILRDAWVASGRWCHNHNMCNLQELISREGDDLHVISVGGGGGGDLGTASIIIRKAYCDPKTCENFKNRAWVKLTHPFNHDEFIKSMLTQLCATSHQANTSVDLWTRMDLMKAELVQQMSEQRYLVVLQDVFTSQDWDVIRMYLPDSNNGSRIVVSTPQLGIALLCTGEPYQVSELQHFSDGRFICAFFKKMQSTMDHFKCQLRRSGGVISMSGAFDGFLDRQRAINNHGKEAVRQDFRNRRGGHLGGNRRGGHLGGNRRDGLVFDPLWLLKMRFSKGKLPYTHKVVDIMYKGIINRLKEFDGIKFGRHSWVDVPYPFDLEVFAQRLFLNFYSDDIRRGEIMEVGNKGMAGLIEQCRRFLFEEDCLVVINGLWSTDDWDQIESNFLVPSSEPASSRTIKGCILVVTVEEAVAMHCVKDHPAAAFHVKHLEADTAIVNLIEKGTWYCELGQVSARCGPYHQSKVLLEEGKKGRLFYDKRGDTYEWEKVVSRRPFYTSDLIGMKSGLVMVSGKNIAAVRTKAFLKTAYHQDGRLMKLPRRSWVDKLSRDVTDEDSFLKDFSWRLLLDFHSDDPETIAVGLMGGTVDPIDECRKLLLEEAGYLVVISAPSFSENHWDLIRKKLLSGHIQGTIIVDATDDFFSRCDWLANQCTKRIEAKHVGYVDGITKEYFRLFFSNKSERGQKADEECSEEFQLVGRKTEEHNLSHIVNKNCVVSVWGIPGVGKSSLVTKVYYREISVRKTHEHCSFKSFCWVDAPDPFNLTQLCCRLLVDFYSDDPQAKETAAVGLMEGSLDPIQECFKFIHKQKCLVVIDGLHSTQDWDMIRATLLSEPTITGTTIVVITSAEKVAMHCVQNVQDRVLNIRRLEAGAAHDLLVRKITSDYGPLTSEETEKTESIVTKCGGLPKVITAIGEACNLHLKHLRMFRSSKHCMWPPGGNFINDLETEPEFHGLRPLFSWMQSYFYACSDSIKPCIFYLSIFPLVEKKNIRRRRLLLRWIAEGYCRDTSDGGTCEENGEKYISELLKLSIIQELPRNEVFCQVNGFFHEYIMSRPMEDNLVFALEGSCSLNSQRGGQHLAIRSSWDRDENVYESIDFSRLRSLTVFGKWKSFLVSSKKVKMRLLRVLDLEDAKDVTNDDLGQITKVLTRLKFLSLRGHTEITCLPSSIGGLRQLETLDMRHTSIVTLPPVITKLQKLRYIRAGTTEMWDWNEGDQLVLADGGEDTASAAAAAAAQAPELPTTAGTPIEDEDHASSIPEVTNSREREATTIEDEEHTSEPQENGVGNLPTECCRPLTFVSSLPSKLRRRRGLDNNGGVKVPAGIGELFVLHTLGVVKVNAQCSKAIFQELKKLTQLRKLGVSGINKGNIRELCEAISGHAHLKSLSVELDKDDDGLDGLLGDNDDIPPPPKTIKSLKLYGRVQKLLLVWVMQLGNNLDKLKVDLTIEKPEELPHPIQVVYQWQLVPDAPQVSHLRIRPIKEGELHIGNSWMSAHVLEIQCSSKLSLTFDVVMEGIEVLKVDFSSSRGSISKISGLSYLQGLKEVWLKGHSDAHKQFMQQQINKMRLREDLGQKRPVLKLVQTSSS